MSKAITSRSQDYSQWYNDLVIKGGLADYSAVRGCMVIKPYGFTLWENMRDELDRRFKETGHQNAYFPLFVPKSLFEAEEKNAEGFAKECAVVTHYRLKTDPNNKGKLMVDPEAKLEEELVVRPTSEAIIWNTYKDWIKSYRDLPILVNQWANVVRWEMRTRLFLRTAEFLWQEGHTAHATDEDAMEETIKMLNVYAAVCEEILAIPVVKGQKTEKEKFAGAKATFTIESLMHDGKALQSGTSHHFGTGFAEAFNIQYTDKEGKLQYVHQTSWGFTTRIIGALIMVHGDDRGLVIPPKAAPTQVMIVPIAQHKEGVLDFAYELKETLSSVVRVGIDASDKKPGWKFNEYEMKGIPVRLEVGPKDIENKQVVLVRRDTLEKVFVPLDQLETKLVELLDEIQTNLYNKALTHREERTTVAVTLDELKQSLEAKPGFIKAMWCGELACEEKIKEDAGATSRCLPFEQEKVSDKCVCCGKEANKMVYWAKAY